MPASHAAAIPCPLREAFASSSIGELDFRRNRRITIIGLGQIIDDAEMIKLLIDFWLMRLVVPCSSAPH